MGCVHNIDYDKFPHQSVYVGDRVTVCFNYDTSRCLEGEIVRDDTTDPFVGLIRLDDGRIIRMCECQYKTSNKPLLRING